MHYALTTDPVLSITFLCFLYPNSALLNLMWAFSYLAAAG